MRDKSTLRLTRRKLGPFKGERMPRACKHLRLTSLFDVTIQWRFLKATQNILVTQV